MIKYQEKYNIMKNPKIVVVGSCNTDMVVKANKLPAPGETVLGGTFLMNPGGKGANQAVAAARLGGNVALISKIGNDLFGKQSIELFRAEGIDTDYVFTDNKNPSGVALISVDSSGENCIIVASGANSSLDISDINKAQKILIEASIILIQFEIPMQTVEYVIKFASKYNKKIILNPAPAQILSEQFLTSISLIIPNRIEAELLTGIKVYDWESAKKAADKMEEKGLKNIIITLGSLGVLVKTKSNHYIISAHEVKAVDTTAAGDTFCGALCVALSEGQDIISAAKFANKASSITITRMGAQSSIPNKKELLL